MNRSRRERIARSSGKAIQEINQLQKQFDIIYKIIERVSWEGFNVVANLQRFLKKHVKDRSY